MNASTSVIVEVGAGGRSLLRTADSIARQRRHVADVLLVGSHLHQGASLVDSVATRLNAAVIERVACPGAGVNAAARQATGAQLAVVAAGTTLHDRFIEHCGTAFSADPLLDAIAPVVVLRTPDGIGELHWVPQSFTVAGLLSDTRSVPPAFVLRRTVWESIGGFDETLDGLVHYELWLRLALAGRKLSVLQDAIAYGEVAERSSGDAPDDRDHLQRFRAVLERHAEDIERDMVEVLVSREIRFGQLREVHRHLVSRRDADLEALDRLRAEAAHHRAYLTHHGRGDVDWGDLRRTVPVSRDWGYDRGEPVDRRYIDDFLALHSSDIRGTVLEVQEDDFTRAFGGPRVAACAVLDVDAANRRATLLADLRCAPQIPSNQFDCVILTQTLHVIDDMQAALRECHRILKPGGVLLATMPAASRACLEYGEHGDFWRVTPAGARALFADVFSPSQTATTPFGSVLTNTAFLHGFASSELTDAEFGACDPYFPALTGIRARKADAPPPSTSRGVVLLYHRIDDQSDIHELGVPPALFADHLAWLTTQCTVVPLEDLLTTPPEALPPRAVALTFDDGYVDNLVTAAPLLQNRGVPAAFFLTTRWIDEPGEYWWDALERVLLDSADIPPSLPIELGGREEVLPTGSADDRRQAHWRLHDAMVHAPIGERDRLDAAVRAWCSGNPRRVRPMTREEIRQLSALPGMTIGAHTVNHLSLPDQRPEEVTAEIEQSRVDLARVIGRSVDQFAYPYGAVDRSSAASVRRSCRWGVSCDETPLGASFDAARVPRLDVKRWSTEELGARIARLFQPVKRSAPRAFALVP
jgi:peptidoglycan/xylan/chitin deacetylase (PgdA/CDA1 family)/SAM-dependent methyltransferase